MRLPPSLVNPLRTHRIPGFIGNHGLSIVVERSKLLRSKSSNSFSGVLVFCAMTTPPDTPRHVNVMRIAKKGTAIEDALFMTPPPVRESQARGDDTRHHVNRG